MKVFISHSSREKWIARKISEDIEALGAKTFLDEKDIETGEPIDSTINEHLKDSDDFLLLLSPSSLKSSWVLMELGGARVLEKTIIPVLLFLGTNEIPTQISRYLARDINDIDKYYTELRKRIRSKSDIKKPDPQEVHIREKPTVAVEPGMRVKIFRPESSFSRPELGWNDEMENFAGNTVTVTKSDGRNRAFKINEDGGRFVWAYEWVIPVDAN